MKLKAFTLLSASILIANIHTIAEAEVVAGVTLTTPTKRDALAQPFHETSIWNTPIGSGAVYVPAKLSATPRNDPWAPMPQIDDEVIVLRPTAPVTAISTSSVGWSGGNRCVATGPTLIWAPIPSDLVVTNTRNNNSAVFLASDNRTLLQLQPFTRCTVGGTATALMPLQSIDLYGDGRYGSHGGSRLSAIGGSLRVGELRPGGQPPRHALKINVDSPYVMAKCSATVPCFRWPAFVADSGAASTYGSQSTTAPAGMKMGALLAIPASVDITKIGLETKPAQMLAWTLQNYGAYIVDTTGGAAFALSAENGPDGSKRVEFKKDWGFELEGRVRDNTPWTRDIQRLVVQLALVDNNSPTTIGGGGKPRQPIAPALTVPK